MSNARLLVRPNPLGDRIADLREAKGWTRSELARRAKVTEGYIRQIEHGVNPQTGRPISPSIEKLGALAAALGVDPGDLFALVGGRPNRQAADATPKNHAVEKQAAATAVRQGLAGHDSLRVHSVAPRRLPVFGFVACGSGSLPLDHPEEWETWPAEIAAGSEAVVVARGMSMYGDGIREGDRLLVRRLDGEHPADGKTVVARLDDGTITCKRYRTGRGGSYLAGVPGQDEPDHLVIPVGPGSGVVLVALVLWVCNPR